MTGAREFDALLAAALPEGSLFSVGGRVRDELRAGIENTSIPAKDLDYVVVGVPISDLQKTLETLGRVDLVGASFAILKLTVEGNTVDVALPRRERSVGVGHREFEIESGPSIPLEDDLGRRDFRMNMIARALPSGTLVDPYGGQADITAKRIDILRAQAFEEDPLRMLRAAQFAARFGYLLTEQTRHAMTISAALIGSVSAERIGEELAKLLTLAPKPSVGLELLRETGLLAHLWPEFLEGVGVEQNQWHAYDCYTHTLETLDATPPGDLVLRLAALFHDVGKPRVKDGPHFYRHEHVGEELVRSMLMRFRFSNETIETVAHLVRSHMYSADPELTDAAIRRFIRRIGPANLQRQFALRAADVLGSGLPKRDGANEAFQQRVWAEVERRPAFSLKDLQIGGAEVIEAMVRRDKAPPDFRGDASVGAALHWLFEQVTDQPERNERSCLLALLNQYLDDARNARSS